MRQNLPNIKSYKKALLLKFVRSRIWQPVWKRLHHYSLIGMNFWGGASVDHSGEVYAIGHMSSHFQNEQLLVVFDVGANLGKFAFHCVEITSRRASIYSFEPSRATFLSLKEHIEKKHYEAHVIPINSGVSDTCGSMKLYSSEPNSSIASVYDLKNPIREFHESLTEKIDVVTIDNFCSENEIDFIHYLKIDIEGHEYQALLGCQEMISEAKIHFIQFEFGENNIDSRTFFRDFYDLLHGRYEFFRIVSDGLTEINGYSSELEIFATVNYLAVLK